jgi:hypothetical protein
VASVVGSHSHRHDRQTGPLALRPPRPHVPCRPLLGTTHAFPAPAPPVLLLACHAQEWPGIY